MIDPVLVDVDEEALGRLGWVAEDVRARLVTEQLPDGAVRQQVAVAGQMRFDETAWAPRFSHTGQAPKVLITLNRVGGVALPSYAEAVTETAAAAAKRPIRFTESTESWITEEPQTAEGLEVGITGFDLDSVLCSFSLPPLGATTLPIDVIDESTWPSLVTRATATAELVKDRFGEQLRIHLEGTIDTAPVADLLADLLAHGPGARSRLFDEPHLPLPAFVAEVSDDTNFLLAKRPIKLLGSIPTTEDVRPARFAAGLRVWDSNMPGTPARVVMRIMDSVDVPVS